MRVKLRVFGTGTRRKPTRRRALPDHVQRRGRQTQENTVNRVHKRRRTREQTGSPRPRNTKNETRSATISVCRRQSIGVETSPHTTKERWCHENDTEIHARQYTRAGRRGESYKEVRQAQREHAACGRTIRAACGLT